MGGSFTLPCHRSPPSSYARKASLDAHLRGMSAGQFRELTMSKESNAEGNKAASKTGGGNFFEDFRVGQTIKHATPRTITVGDVALYLGLFGARFAVQSSDAFAQAIGYPRAPVDDLLVFH